MQSAIGLGVDHSTADFGGRGAARRYGMVAVSSDSQRHRGDERVHRVGDEVVLMGKRANWGVSQ